MSKCCATEYADDAAKPPIAPATIRLRSFDIPPNHAFIRHPFPAPRTPYSRSTYRRTHATSPAPRPRHPTSGCAEIRTGRRATTFRLMNRDEAGRNVVPRFATLPAPKVPRHPERMQGLAAVSHPSGSAGGPYAKQIGRAHV